MLSQSWTQKESSELKDQGVSDVALYIDYTVIWSWLVMKHVRNMLSN